MLGLIDRPNFDKVVRKHDTNKYSKGVDTWTHFVSMLNNLDSNRVIYVTKLKKNVNFKIVKELPVNEKNEHKLSDQIIMLTGDKTKNNYSGKIRVIKVYDSENDQTLILMTNNFTWTANTISQLYKAR